MSSDIGISIFANPDPYNQSDTSLWLFFANYFWLTIKGN